MLGHWLSLQGSDLGATSAELKDQLCCVLRSSSPLCAPVFPSAEWSYATGNESQELIQWGLEETGSGMWEGLSSTSRSCHTLISTYSWIICVP